MKKKVALVLASGGSRGMAHIGAIEELESRGYEISAIAGCSIGSLVGGIYACGKLKEAHEWFCQLDRQQIMSLADVSLGLSHVVKGDKVLNAIQEFVPDRRIEDLPIPLSLVATDIIHAKEVVFEKGSLFEAIRASISIPLFFRPVKYQGTLLVDGGVINPFPLNVVKRTDDDLLVGVNISAQDTMDVDMSPTHEAYQLPALPQMLRRFSRLSDRWEQLSDRLEQFTQEQEENSISPQVNYLSLINRSIDVQLQRNGQLMTEFYHPDVLVEIPQSAYTTFDFDKAEEILQYGRERMRRALDKFESTQH